MSRDAALEAYFAEAASWDADRIAQTRRITRIAWWVAGAGWTCAIATSFALMLLMPLKRVDPFVIRVDNSTGLVDVVPVYVGQAEMPETVARYFLDHYVILIFPTVVIGLEAVYGRSYGDLLVLSTAAFTAFGLFALPAGWLADKWSRRNMIALFFFGTGICSILVGVSESFETLAIALFGVGVFAAIYHPVGTPMIVDAAVVRGRTMAFNGICGNIGVSIASGCTAIIAATVHTMLRMITVRCIQRTRSWQRSRRCR